MIAGVSVFLERDFLYLSKIRSYNKFELTLSGGGLSGFDGFNYVTEVFFYIFVGFL